MCAVLPSSAIFVGVGFAPLLMAGVVVACVGEVSRSPPLAMFFGLAAPAPPLPTLVNTMTPMIASTATMPTMTELCTTTLRHLAFLAASSRMILAVSRASSRRSRLVGPVVPLPVAIQLIPSNSGQYSDDRRGLLL